MIASEMKGKGTAKTEESKANLEMLSRVKGLELLKQIAMLPFFNLRLKTWFVQVLEETRERREQYVHRLCSLWRRKDYSWESHSESREPAVWTWPVMPSQ
jgi:hypothetical protein